MDSVPAFLVPIFGGRALKGESSLEPAGVAALLRSCTSPVKSEPFSPVLEPSSAAGWATWGLIEVTFSQYKLLGALSAFSDLSAQAPRWLSPRVEIIPALLPLWNGGLTSSNILECVSVISFFELWDSHAGHLFAVRGGCMERWRPSLLVLGARCSTASTFILSCLMYSCRGTCNFKHTCIKNRQILPLLWPDTKLIQIYWLHFSSAPTSPRTLWTRDD